MKRKILLLIPGYYGSRLKEEKTGAVRWAKVSNFLFSQQGLSVNIPGTSIGSETKLVDDGLLTNVKIVHKFWDVDAYGVTMKQLEVFAKDEGMRLEVASYDWRDDFINCIRVLDEKIKSFELKEDDELHVVAHSLGALLMSYYIRYGVQDVEGDVVENWEGSKAITKLALVAPPLHGLMILFRDIQDGTRLGANRTLLSGKDYSTFKSSYFFLPPKGEDIGINEKGENFSLGIHDIKKWQHNRWGPFKFAKNNEGEEVHKFVSKHMHRSARFHELLRAEVVTKPEKKLALLHMRGLGHKTLELAKLRVRNGRAHYSFGRKSSVDGDGTVTAKSGAPLAFFKYMDFNSVDTEFGHLDILAHSKAQSVIQNFFKK